MAQVQMPTSRDDADLQIDMTDVDGSNILIEMGSEVEVVATPKKGRGRPRGNKSNNIQTSPDESPPRPKRNSRKRPAKTSSDHVSKARKKFTKRSRKDDRYIENEKNVKDDKNRRSKRKKDSNDKKSRPPRDRNQRRKSNLKGHSPIHQAVEDKYASSDDDSVVIMEDIPAPVTIPSTPPDGSPYNSRRYEMDRPRRLEDSSSDDSSSSSSSSDSDSDYSKSSVGSRLTDKSDRSVERVPTPANNGYDHRNPSPLGWSRCTSSESEDDQIVKVKNGSGPQPGTPPRSPSSASSESADKSFQCHTCRKWFSSTVTLRIHKKSHISKPGGSTSSGGRSSRRYECDCCSATFTRRERLEQHRIETHRGSLTVQCEVCGRGFEDEEQQKKHAATHTADERAGRCSACGEVTGGWEQLRRHKATHAAPANHACPLCRKVFTYVQSLSRHLLNHSKAVYKCVVCKTSFDDANALATHLNSHLDRYKQLKT